MATLYTSNLDSDTAGLIAPGWTAGAGTWQVGTNFPVSGAQTFTNITDTDAQKAAYTTGSTSQADQTFALSFAYNGSARSYACPMIRCNTTASNGYLALFTNTGGQLRIYKVVAGVATQLAVAAFAGTAGTSYSIEISAVGTAIEARMWALPGSRPTTATVSITDATYTAGTAGLYWAKPSGATQVGGVDDLLWTDAAGAPTLAAIPVDNAGLFWSPYNWDTLAVSDFGVSTKSMQTTACGAYLKFQITGTTSVDLLIDASTLSGFGANTPRLMWSVDYGQAQYGQLTAGASSFSIATGLVSGTTHTIQVYVLGSVEAQGTRWGSAGVSPTNVVRIQGINAVTGATISGWPTLRTKRMAMFGDSLIEGVRAAGTTTQPADHARSCAWFVGQGLNAEYGTLGYGATGWQASGSGSMPALPTTWNAYSSGRSRSFTGIDYVFVMHGYNGTTAQSDVQTWIGNVRAAVGAAAWIFVVNAPSGRAAATQIAAVTAYKAANPSDTKVISIDYSDRIPVTSYNNSVGSAFYETTDGVHPLEFANAQIAAAIVDKAEAAITAASGSSGGSTGAVVIDLGGVGLTNTGGMVVIA